MLNIHCISSVDCDVPAGPQDKCTCGNRGMFTHFAKQIMANTGMKAMDQRMDVHLCYSTTVFTVQGPSPLLKSPPQDTFYQRNKQTT